MPVFDDPVDGLAVPAHLLQAWTARLVGFLGTNPMAIGARLAVPFVAGRPVEPRR